MAEPVPAPRRARTDDLAALVALERRCFETPWSEAMVRTEITHPGSAVWVLDGVDDERLAAAAMFRFLVPEAELLRLAVDPDLRRRGLAGHLLTACLETLHAHGIDRCHLEARADNVAALGLYRRLGFEEVGRRRGYYPAVAGASGTSPAVDAVLLRRGTAKTPA